MAPNVKSIGTLDCKTRHELGEWVVYYVDPDSPGVESRFGGGRKFKTSHLAVTGLAVHLRSRGYTGSLRNVRPVQGRKHGVFG